MNRKKESKDFQFDEAVKMVRANIEFSGENIQAVAVTSTLPGEGKSEISYQLAASFAESRKNTLLLDCDIRLSSLVNRFEITEEVKGLSEYLCGKAKASDIINKTDLEGLYVVFAGRTVPNPAELLSSQRFMTFLENAKTKFDVIILDTPPITSVVDGAMVASKCDGVAVVVESGRASRRLVMKTKQQLIQSGAKILGTVLNKVDTKKGSYYYSYYGYGKYGEYSKKYSDQKKAGTP